MPNQFVVTVQRLILYLLVFFSPQDTQHLFLFVFLVVFLVFAPVLLVVLQKKRWLFLWDLCHLQPFACCGFCSHLRTVFSSWKWAAPPR